MIDNILIVGNQVLILFILIAVGFICNKTKIIKDNAIKSFTDFALYIVSPCVIINSYQREFDTDMLNSLILTCIVTFVSFAINIFIANIVVRDKDKRREKVLRFGAIFSNCGYMSLPLQAVLLGDDGVFFGATYIAAFNIVLWTYGVYAMSGSMKEMSLRKIVLNPGIIGTLLGMALFVLSIELPSFINEPIRYFASLNTPVPMVIIGYHLANASLKIKGLSAYISMFFRLILSPLIMFAGLYLCGIRGTVMVACVIAGSAPFAATTTMFAEKFGGETELSAAMVSLSTLVSIITMPIIVGFVIMFK